MDPITSAILIGVSSKIASGAIKDGYAALMERITKKLGENNTVIDAIAALKVRPDSEARIAVLGEEVASANISGDHEIRMIARHIETEFGQLPQEVRSGVPGIETGSSVVQNIGDGSVNISINDIGNAISTANNQTGQFRKR